MSEQRVSKKMTEHKSRTVFAKNEGRCHFFLGDTENGKKVLQVIDGLIFSILITIVTIITLFSDDIRQIFFTSEADLTFTILTLICMFIYLVQMITLSLLKEGYFLKFYFWLDLISTLTMILDLIWITELINSAGSGVDAATNIAKIARASRASKIGAKSTKLIRIIRLIRILRLYKTASNRFAKEEENHRLASADKKKNSFDNLPLEKKLSKRLERIREASRINFKTQGQVKHQVSLNHITFHGSNRKLSALNPNNPNNMRRMSHLGSFMRDKPIGIDSVDNLTHQKKNVMEEQENMEHQPQSEEYPSVKKVSTGDIGELDIDVPAQTMVGSKLKDEIQKNIISMILLILISIPLLNASTYYDRVTSYDKGIEQLQYFAQNFPNSYDTQAHIFINEMRQLPSPLIFFSIKVNETCCQFPANYSSYEDIRDVESLRTDELYIVPTSSNSTIVFDVSSTNILNAQLNIGRTLFVCFLLIIATLLLSNDVETHALEPLENMINTVKRISSDPLHAIKEIQKQMMIKKTIPQDPSKQPPENQELIALFEQNEEQKTEPAILQNMIVKIGSLLAVGFGEAGTELIARNIQNNGSLNVMIPGKKIMAIYGFCDIRNFTDATEILEAQVMVFVNQIAQICHDVVNRVGGNPNKNIGDAFLLVWKFKQENTMIVQNAKETTLELRIDQKVKQMADLAVYSFVKIVAEITKSHMLQKYRQNAKLKERIPNYNGVKMGFGLHVGWSIEGPIGSQFKIDSSYLGANVNMSSRLEGATKQYGIPILISQTIYDLMTLKIKENLRQIDRVYVKEGEKPMNLYTVDLSTENLLKVIGVNSSVEKTPFEKKKMKVHHNLLRDKLMQVIETKRVTYNIWNEDKDIAVMREPFSKYFFDEWKKGFAAFESGKWAQALQCFKSTKIMGLNHRDGPSQNLIEYINKFDGLPPLGWQGVREFNG